VGDLEKMIETAKAEMEQAEQDDDGLLIQTAALANAIVDVACRANQICPGGATFDQLAEEVLELHLSLRGKHKDAPAMEWLEIATIAINALEQMPIGDVDAAWLAWINRHDRRQDDVGGETARKLRAAAARIRDVQT